jgi:hypothetical protein
MTTVQSKTSTATTAAAAEVAAASVEDFRHFHGMCCRPSTAKRCIEAFTGVILFMPYTYHRSNDHGVNGQQQQQQQQQHDDSNNISATTSNQKKTGTKEAGAASSASSPDLSSQDFAWILNIWLYYALVVCSLTGLWTVLGKTKFLIGRQEQGMDKNTQRAPLKLPLTSAAIAVNNANSNHDLVMYPCVIEYIQQRYPDSTEFFLARRFEYDFVGLLQVMMLHISDDQGKLHLVEIFKIQLLLLAQAAAVVKSLMQSFKKKANKRD